MSSLSITPNGNSQPLTQLDSISRGLPTRCQGLMSLLGLSRLRKVELLPSLFARKKRGFIRVAHLAIDIFGIECFCFRRNSMGTVDGSQESTPQIRLSTFVSIWRLDSTTLSSYQNGNCLIATRCLSWFTQLSQSLLPARIMTTKKGWWKKGVLIWLRGRVNCSK